MTTEAPNTPLPADHAEVSIQLVGIASYVESLKIDEPLPPEEQDDIALMARRAATLITSQAEEIERITKEKQTGDAACRIVAELVALIPIPETLEASKNGLSLVEWFKRRITRAEAAESSLSSMTERCKELAQMLDLFTRHYEDWMDRYPDSTSSSSHSWHTFGDLRRARALSQTTKGEKS